MNGRGRSRIPSALLRAVVPGLFAALLSTACHATTTPIVVASPPATVSSTIPAVRPAPTSVDTLSHSIDAILDDPVLSRGTWGVAVRSLDRNEAIYQRSSGKLMMPASTLKVVTLATAAERLGWDFTYPTTLYRLGRVANGVLTGDLLVVGSGDPGFDDWAGAATTRFREWAVRLKEAGVESVTGRVIGDDNAFDDEALGSGWAWDDVAASYATSVGALQFNENTAQVVVTPGASAGDPPSVDVRPLTAILDVRNHATTSLTGPPLVIRPMPRSTVLEVTGAVQPGSAAVIRNVSVPNPTMYFATAARTGLSDGGIEIGGEATDLDDISTPIDRASAVKVAEFRSPSLSVMAATMMKLSQNLFAESLLKTMGATGQTPGSATGGRDAVVETLTRWGVDPRDLLMVDGSGLSRYNLITPDAEVAVLAHVHADARLRNPFVEALSLAGVDGTLERRMMGTAAERNARAKSGSFSNARGLSGFVRTADGEQLVFCILANNYNAPAAAVDTAMDAIVVALAGFNRQEQVAK